MANTQSAKKRIRQNEKRRVRNQTWQTRARTYVKRAREALATKELDSASAAVRIAASELDRAAAKGAIHHRNAARRKGRLMKQLSELEQSQ